MTERVHVAAPARGRKKKFDDPTADHTPDQPHPALKSVQRISKEQMESVHNQLAEDFQYFRNELVECLAEEFPYDRDLQYVDRYYPNAKGGPLYIDSPQTKYEEEACQKKAHSMLGAGLRYCFILPGEYLEDVLKRFERVLDDVHV